MGQLPNNEIPANRASQNQRAPRASVHPRVQPVSHGDIAGEIRGIVSRPLTVPARPHSAFPKLIAVIGVLLVAGLVVAKIQNEKSSRAISSDSSSTGNSEIQKAPSAAQAPVTPRQNVKAQTERMQMGITDQAREPQAPSRVALELQKFTAGVKKSSPSEQQVKSLSRADTNDTSIPDSVESSTSNSSYNTGKIRSPYVPLTTPTEKTPMPEREMLPLDSASSTPEDSGAPTGVPFHDTSSVTRQRTLTPDQKLAAGIPYETRRIGRAAAPSFPLQRTLTPDQKRAAGIPYEARPVVNLGESTGLRRTQPPTTSTRPRADARVPLLPPPPGLR